MIVVLREKSVNQKKQNEEHDLQPQVQRCHPQQGLNIHQRKSTAKTLGYLNDHMAPDQGIPTDQNASDDDYINAHFEPKKETPSSHAKLSDECLTTIVSPKGIPNAQVPPTEEYLNAHMAPKY